jgi:hypothetical protein
MKAYPLVMTLAVFSLLLAGCATPFRAPADVSPITLERGNSPVVIVEKIWLERKSGPLMLKGFVLKRLTAEDTTQTHPDVTFYDQTGRVLHSAVTQFEPQQIMRNPRGLSQGSYALLLDPLPPGTTHIKVPAHEGIH